MDWVAFLQDNHIGWVSRGPNTKRGEVSVHCPWCGEDDPSEHLGISLTTENWGCLRSMQHRGHSPVYLIQGLLGCSAHQARLVVTQYSVPDPDALGCFEAPLTPLKVPQVNKQRLPVEARAIAYDGTTGRFWRYLWRRGFDDPNLVCMQYHLSCCTTGPYQSRIVIPVYGGGKLLGWQARAIGAVVSAPRYLSSGEAVKQTVFNMDVEGGKTLYVCEGPFDALKVDYYGQAYQARAVCGFGVNLTTSQIATINEIAKRFDQTVLLYDSGATEAIFNVIEWLPGAVIGELPPDVKDPGDLTKAQVEWLVSK